MLMNALNYPLVSGENIYIYCCGWWGWGGVRCLQMVRGSVCVWGEDVLSSLVARCFLANHQLMSDKAVRDSSIPLIVVIQKVSMRCRLYVVIV